MDRKAIDVIDATPSTGVPTKDMRFVNAVTDWCARLLMLIVWLFVLFVAVVVFCTSFILVAPVWLIHIVEKGAAQDQFLTRGGFKSRAEERSHQCTKHGAHT